jgi:hypothetical protein
MKRIMLVAVLLVAVSMLLFGCELFQPQADVSIVDADYDHIGDPDYVYVDCRIENTGTMDIAEWTVQVKVQCSGGPEYGSDNWGPLETGQVKFINNIEVYVGTDAPANYPASNWVDLDVSVNEVDLVAE